MTSDEILERLGPWLERHRRSAWKPDVEEGEGGPTASKFGGIPWTGPQAPWPDCGVCQQPLTPLLQLDLDDLPEGLGETYGGGLLQLFYCTRDECQGRGGWDPFGDDLSRVRVVRPDGSAASEPPPGAVLFPAKAIVGWTRCDDLPTPEEHDEQGLTCDYDFEEGTARLRCEEVGLDVTRPISQLAVEEIANGVPGDKLAGWPLWVQGVEYPDCPRCGARMLLVFQVDSEDNVPFMFGDAGCGHITQCPEHKDVVAFGWACS